MLGSLLVHVQGSGVLPALPGGIAYTRAIPYNVPPFAAAVSFLRTGPKAVIAPAAALLPPHLHARHGPVIAPHVHAAPAPFYPAVSPPLAVAPHIAPVAFGGVPAILPHAASPVPHVGVLPAPHAHILPHAHVAPALPAPVPAPHVYPYVAHPAHAFVPAPHHVHAYAAPAVQPAPHVQALPHVHGPAAFAPLVARGHLHHHDSLHHHRR